MDQTNANRRLRLRRRVRTLGIVAAIAFFIGVIFGLYNLSDDMKPAKKGWSKEFWGLAAGIHWDNEEPTLTGLGNYSIVDDDLYYEKTHLHGSTLFVIEKEDAWRFWQQVEERLIERAKERKEPDAVVKGYLKWKSELKQGEEPDVEAAVRCIYEARIAENEFRRNHDSLAQHFLEARIHKARNYAVNFIIEFVWLTMLIWLLFSALFRRMKSAKAFAFWMMLPCLFYLPFHLGYGATSLGEMGAEGGVLYPQLIETLGNGLQFEFDRIVWSHLPQIFSVVSEHLGSLSPPMNIGTAWGPVTLLVIGLIPGFVAIRLTKWLNATET